MEYRDDRRDATAGGKKTLKRVYSRPKLEVYGPLAKLTRGSVSGVGETSPQGAMRMSCL